MSKLKPYPKYKPVAYDYISQLPDSWDIWKISHIFRVIGSGTTPTSGTKEFYENGEIEWVNTGDLNDDYIIESKNKINQIALKTFSTLKKYPANTLLIAMYGATIGKTGIITKESCTNQACCALSNSKNALNRFVQYWFIANRKNIVNLSYGGGQPNISQDVIKKLKIPLPPLSEQNVIVAFLDQKTEQIQTFISKKQRLIELLEEKKKAVITKLISKGLNSNANYRETELGKIPQHWKIVNLKYLLNGKLKYGANEEAKDFDTDAPRYIRITDFGLNGELREDTFCSLPIKKAKEYLLKEGDILFARSGATVGKTFQFKNYNGLACFAGYLIKATPNEKEISSDFLFLYTKSNLYENWKNQIFNKATIENIGADKYSLLKIIVPPKEEQKQIVKKIEENVERINRAITQAQLEIEKLKEYQESLITQVVTGQVCVV